MITLTKMHRVKTSESSELPIILSTPFVYEGIKEIKNEQRFQESDAAIGEKNKICFVLKTLVESQLKITKYDIFLITGQI